MVAEHIGLPFEGQMDIAGSMNITFKADISRYVATAPRSSTGSSSPAPTSAASAPAWSA